MRREYQEHFLHHRLQRKPLVRDPSDASRYLRRARAVMHVEITYPRHSPKPSFFLLSRAYFKGS